MTRLSLILFIVASTGEILSGVIGSTYLHFVCKPLIMLALGMYYLYHSTYQSKVVWMAVFLSFAGDIALMFESLRPVFFLVGLVAFLGTHIMYTISYRQHQDDSDDNGLKGIQKIRLAFPVVLAGTGLIVILYPALGLLKIPVVIYATVLIIMVVNAVFRYGRTVAASFWSVFIGSVLFMVSDALLAINKFLEIVPNASGWIMGAYILAQFSIINGLCIHVNKTR